MQPSYLCELVQNVSLVDIETTGPVIQHEIGGAPISNDMRGHQYHSSWEHASYS